MSWTVTLILFAASIALSAWCAWRGARPPDPTRGPRLVPWRFLMLLSAAGAFLLLLHVMALAKGSG